MRAGRSRWGVAVPVVCLVAGLLLATSRQAADGGDLRPAGSARLSDLVRQAQADVDQVEARRAELRTTLDGERDAAAAGDSDVAAAAAVAAELGGPAGLTALSGPGLTVSLTDASRRSDGSYAPDAAPDDLVVHQQDVQSVLNALWAGGADAVSVQDERITTTSAPRCIGNTLLLHGRTYSPPYVLRAIGDPERLRTALDSERGVTVYRQYVQRFGLGYEVTAGPVEVPAYGGPVALTEAAAGAPR
ncbi:DUF881 domain-containing protein [Rhodococcus aerolatus]